MFKIAILACDNGYGHLKRCLLIAYYLSSQGISVDLYGDSSGFKIAKNIEFNPKKKPTLIPWNFSYDIKYFLSNGCKSFKVLDKLPQLSKYDLVLSDKYNSYGFNYYSNRIISPGKFVFDKSNISEEAQSKDLSNILWKLSQSLIENVT